ncbi:MAG: amidohydrolase family protein, partial [Candidatus Binataceae bacterium]
PALDVITWATRNGAELMGMKDELGTIESGKLADLLVVNGDPVKDITILQDRARLDVIMKEGHMVECQLTPARLSAKAA